MFDKRFVWILLMSAFCLVLSLSAFAQSLVPAGKQRAHRWDLAMGAVFQNSESVSGQNASKLDLDSVTGFTVSFDYNFNNHVAVGFGMDFLRPDYRATVNPDDGSGLKTIRHTADMFNGQFRGIWNILEGPLTPFVQASIGWTHIDSNWASEPPSVGCWWDPWWGYVCANFWNTYTDTSMSYGFAGGLRWDITNMMFVRGSYSVFRPEWDVDSGKPTFGQGRFELGWRF